jgi:hypothetical protein
MQVGSFALDRHNRHVIALVARSAERGMRIIVPATARAQAIRNPARHVRLVRLIRQVSTDLVALDGPESTAVGILLASTRTTDIVDVHVVVCAREAGQSVITSDPKDLRPLCSRPGLGSRLTHLRTSIETIGLNLHYIP